jgi:excinuclease ABC subunit C
MKNDNKLQIKIENLPLKPGVYIFKDKQKKILYIGKAKNLRKRVSSYFQKKQKNYKTNLLVNHISDLEVIIVTNESEALLLENNMVKESQPRFNIQLKDDKTFPWIVIKNERFPRVFLTRNKTNDGSEYFGPYTSVRAVKILLELIKTLYPLRNCKYNLSKENIEKGKIKVCLEYHIGNCMGPCEGFQSENDYQESIKNCRKIVQGNLSEVSDTLKQVMNGYSKQYKYEKANQVKEKIELLAKYQNKSTIVNASINNVDVFTIIDSVDSAFVNYLKVVKGAIIQVHSVEIKKKIYETTSDVLSYAIVDIRRRLFSNADEIIVPFEPEIKLEAINYIVPIKGDKKKLLELSERNVIHFKKERERENEINQSKNKTNRILGKIKDDIGLLKLPVRMECFDNSNIQGTNPVAACVVFINAKPAKKEYRHFIVKTVQGPDDYSSMEEIVFRRYKRMLKENKELPQLIVIDGGRGQLHAAMKSLKKLGIQKEIDVIGIAKRLEEIVKPDDPVPLYLNKASESLKVIQHLRNEAHRFGITHHRDKRSKQMLHSELDTIRGIGDKSIEKLIKRFGSVEKIKNASNKDMIELIGEEKARSIFLHFSG